MSSESMSGASRYAGYDLVGLFLDTPTAREAAEALVHRGIDANQVDVKSPSAGGTIGKAETRQEDLEANTETGRSAGKGVVLGLAVGALIGLIAGMVAFGFGTGGMWALTGGFAIAGAAYGLTAGGIKKAMDTDAARPSPEVDDDGQVAVVVRVTDDDEREKALKALRSAGPTRLLHHDAQGNLVNVD